MIRKETYERLQAQMGNHLYQFFAEAQPHCAEDHGYKSWLYMSSLKVYLRIWEHEVDNAMKWCLDVANIRVKERYRGRGHFSIFMDLVQCLNPCEVLYLECVQNPLLLDWCARHGWKQEPQHKVSYPCFFSLKQGGFLPSFEQEMDGMQSYCAGLAWETESLKDLRPYEQWRTLRFKRDREKGARLQGQLV